MQLGELLSARKLTNRLTRPILLDADAAIRCARARQDVEQAQAKVEYAERAEDGRMLRPSTDAAKARLAEAESEQAAADEAAEDHLVDFVFESVGSTRWSEMLEEHPSLDEQKERLGDQDPGYDLKSWPVAVVAECLVDPAVAGPADVQRLKDDAPEVVWDQILSSAVRVNMGANTVPKSRSGSKTTTGSEPRSEQP